MSGFDTTEVCFGRRHQKATKRRSPEESRTRQDLLLLLGKIQGRGDSQSYQGAAQFQKHTRDESAQLMHLRAVSSRVSPQLYEALQWKQQPQHTPDGSAKFPRQGLGKMWHSGVTRTGQQQEQPGSLSAVTTDRASRGQGEWKHTPSCTGRLISHQI